MLDYNSAILEAAGEHLGLEEWPGSKHNPIILSMFAAVGHRWVQDDETPWCAAFVGAVLAQLGLPNTGKLNARSYLDWGHEVSLSQAMPGDVVILWRKSRAALEGHVAFLVGFQGDKVILRGGNQGNKVSDAVYPVSRILGIRRVSQVTDTGRPTLRQGDRGAFVLDMQDQLQRLGYFAGQLDGIFGPLTAAALRDFQNRESLEVDGICGPLTWEALTEALPKPERNVTEESLKEAGSETIKSADVVEKLVAGGGALTIVREGAEAAEEADSFLDMFERLILDHWATIVIVGVALVAVFLYTRKIKAARVRDARTGANVRR